MKIPLVWSTYKRIPENHNSVHVFNNFPFYKWDCDMYLSWPNDTALPHPGPSFLWTKDYNYAYKLKPENPESVFGMDCVMWDEPKDWHSWNDNAMCLPSDSVFEMKFIHDAPDFRIDEDPLVGDWNLETDCLCVDRPGQREY